MTIFTSNLYYFQVESGIEPGIHVGLKSSSEMIETTLAISHVNSILAGLKEWKLAYYAGTFQYKNSMSPRNDQVSMVSKVFNYLGVDVKMEVIGWQES